jgi:cysteine-rich repeat protein
MRKTIVTTLCAVSLAACGDSGGNTVSATGTGTGTATDTPGTTNDPSATGTATESTPTTTDVSGTGTATGTGTSNPTTGTPTTDGPTSDPTTSGPTSDPSTSTPMTSSTDTTDGTTMGVSDGTSSSSSGGPVPVCGDALLDVGEECDDGNDVDNDACSNTCTKVPCDQQMGGGQGGFDFSYLWVSNSPAGTVSKIDTKTAVEVARYVSGPVGKQDPSRTSVSVDGRFAVAVNRNGGITMYAAEKADCKDKNANGMIETSTGPNNVLAWGADECQLWNVDLPGTSNQGPRPVSWTIGPQDAETCAFGMGDVWVGWYVQGQNTGGFRLLNGDDGATLQNVTVPNWSGQNWGPYGGAIDGDNNFWAIGWGQTGPVIKIDGQTFQATNYGNPGGWIYGMGLDAKGNTWAAGCGTANVYRFDKETLKWSTVANVGGSCLRGLQVDSEGRAFIAKNGGCGVAVIDTETLQVINAHVPIPGCSTPVGISIDAEGFVWIVDQGASRAFKMDPDTYQIVATVTGLVSPYTYSDMTGAGINLQTLPQ